MPKIIAITALLVLPAAGFVMASGKLALNPVFTDNMVLQRGMAVEVYGTAAPGSEVGVEIAGRKAKARAGRDGKWTAVLEHLEAGGPHVLAVMSGKEKITLKDVLVGDVWFCSGQSNMEWLVKNTDDGAKELKKFRDNDRVRLFKQAQIPSPKPLENPAGSWKKCTAENAADFSAIAYFFGKRMQKETGVPVGLIMSAWGGTSIEIWMRQSLMEKNPDTAPIVKRWKKSPVFDWKRWNDGRGMAYDIALSNVRFVSKNRGIRTLYLNEGGLGGNWESNAAEGSSISCKGDGKKGRVSGIIAFNSWANAETRLSESGEYDLSGYDEIRFTASGSGRFSVSLGQKSIKDYDYYSSETFDAVLKPEKEYAVRIDSMKQGGWGRAVPFTKNAVEKFKVNIHSTTVELPQSLYNGMVSPFTRYKIKGALWYQGENNAWRAKQYRSLIKMLIRGWRQDWGYEFPFFVVQLPNFMERKDAPGESAWAELREAQLSALELENTAVVPIIDLGDADDIHPRKKDPVAGRLSNAALVMLYNKKAPVTGPLYDSHRQSRRGITVTFKNTGSGLVARGGRLKGFEIAGEDRVFVRARAEIKNSNSVEVSAREVKNPVAVRYAWADNPECNLYNMEGLAASPFRTDKWPGITENNY